MSVQLSERQQQVLRATVSHYIATAEPVGSKALVEEFNLSISPATIRNVMGVLERVGLLYQPHTSAGRIPSDSGYRIYVDELMTPSTDLGQHLTHLLSDRLQSGASMEGILRGAAQLLATLSGCIALITLPMATTAIRHLQLVQVEPGQVMLILITDGYETHSTLLDLPDDGSVTQAEADLEQELQLLTNFLNHHLRGRSLSELFSLDWVELDQKFQSFADCLRTLLTDLTRRSQPSTSNSIFVSGLAEVLRQPEFSELQQMQTILQLLEEEREQLFALIWESPLPRAVNPEINLPQRVQVRIGSENPLEPMRGCTLISSTYQRGTMPLGSVGVLGPTRMAYEKVIALVGATTDYLSAALNPA